METSVDIKSCKKTIKIVSISEILLQSPILSMIVLNAKIDHNEVNFTEPCKCNYSMFFFYGKMYKL